MRFHEDTQQWVHTVQEEKAHGMQQTTAIGMPPSLQKMLNDADKEADRLREIGLRRIEALQTIMSTGCDTERANGKRCEKPHLCRSCIARNCLEGRS